MSHPSDHPVCPHIVTANEGTAYCRLAESTVAALRAELETAQNVVQATRLASIEAMNRIRALVGATEADPHPAEHYVAEALKVLRADVISLTQSRDNWECAAKANDAVVVRLKTDTSDLGQWVAGKMLKPEWDSFKQSLETIAYWKERAEKAGAEAERLRAAGIATYNELRPQIFAAEARAEKAETERTDWHALAVLALGQVNAINKIETVEDAFAAVQSEKALMARAEFVSTRYPNTISS